MCLGIEPALERFGLDDHRHAVMDGLDLRVGRGGDDGERVDGGGVVLVVEPGIPDAGEQEGRFVGAVDVPGLLGFGARDRLPLVEAVDREDGPARADEDAERGLVGDGLASGVDHLGADRAVLGPAGDEAEVGATEPEAVVVVGEGVGVGDEGALGGGGVVVGFVGGGEQVDHRLIEVGVEIMPGAELEEDLEGDGLGEAAAHGGS